MNLSDMVRNDALNAGRNRQNMSMDESRRIEEEKKRREKKQKELKKKLQKVKMKLDKEKAKEINKAVNGAKTSQQIKSNK